jgi:hypothetical protein
MIDEDEALSVPELWYAVRQKDDGSSNYLYKRHADAKAKRRALNLAWWKRWHVMGIVLWAFNGFRQQWSIREEMHHADDV